MSDVITRGSMFPATMVPELVNLVMGHSAIAKLSQMKPIAFNGSREFTFTMDKDVDIVAENGAKGKGGATVTPVTIVPIKFEYGVRVSDEFKYGSEEVRLQYLTAFADGFARKIARGLDIAAFHGLNPRTKAASAVIGANHFDAVDATTSASIITVTGYTSGTDDAAETLDTAIAGVTAVDGEVTGIAMSPAFAADMAKVTNGSTGPYMYPEFRFGGRPAEFAGMGLDINPTVGVVATGGDADYVIAGNFRDAFRWGYAKEIPLEVIEYGNPDNDATLGDLKGHNQVYLRAEAYIGWAILDAAQFAIVRSE